MKLSLWSHRLTSGIGFHGEKPLFWMAQDDHQIEGSSCMKLFLWSRRSISLEMVDMPSPMSQTGAISSIFLRDFEPSRAGLWPLVWWGGGGYQPQPDIYMGLAGGISVDR